MSRSTKSDLPPELLKILKVLSRNIRQIRKDQEMSQGELAEAAGISVTTLNEIESKAQRDIRVSTLSAIAESLDINVIDLFLTSESLGSSSEMEQLLQVSKTLNRIVGKKQKK